MQDITPSADVSCVFGLIRHNQTTIIATNVLDMLDMPSACHLVEGLCWAVLARDTCAGLGAGRPLRVAPVWPGGFSNCRGTRA